MKYITQTFAALLICIPALAFSQHKSEKAKSKKMHHAKQETSSKPPMGASSIAVSDEGATGNKGKSSNREMTGNDKGNETKKTESPK